MPAYDSLLRFLMHDFFRLRANISAMDMPIIIYTRENSLSEHLLRYHFSPRISPFYAAPAIMTVASPITRVLRSEPLSFDI